VLNPHLRRSRRQEARGATEFGGVRNTGSGNLYTHGNDVRTEKLSIEYKTTLADHYRLTLDELRTAERHAVMDGREMAFIVELRSFEYAVLTKDFFIELKGERANYFDFEYRATLAKSYKLNLDELGQLQLRALLAGGEMAMVLGIKDHEYVVLAKDYLLLLLEAAER